jgi:hypothetical protein
LVIVVPSKVSEGLLTTEVSVISSKMAELAAQYAWNIPEVAY